MTTPNNHLAQTRMPSAPNGSHHVMYFSELLKRRVCAGKIKDRIGKLTDLVFTLSDPYPQAVGIYIEHGWGKPTEFVPWNKVLRIEEDAIFVQPPDGSGQYPPFVDQPGWILLDTHLMGRTVLDIDGRKVEVVNNVCLVESGGKLLLVNVDISFNGFLRRIGLGKPHQRPEPCALGGMVAELMANGPRLPVYWGNRNWHPMLEAAVGQMAEDGVERGLGLCHLSIRLLSRLPAIPRQHRTRAANGWARHGEDRQTAALLQSSGLHPCDGRTIGGGVERNPTRSPQSNAAPLHRAQHSRCYGRAFSVRAAIAEACRLVIEGSGVRVRGKISISKSPNLPISRSTSSSKAVAARHRKRGLNRTSAIASASCRPRASKTSSSCRSVSWRRIWKSFTTWTWKSPGCATSWAST